LGKSNSSQIVNMLYPNFNTVLKKINSDEQANVYRVATFFHYFISKNDIRVWDDNQLAYFEGCYDRFPSKKKLSEAFKRSGYKYLLVDLNVATIDNTPGKTLTKKTERLFQFLNNNPHIRMIATDRVMLNANGQPTYTVYGNEVQHYGTYAAFEFI